MYKWSRVNYLPNLPLEAEPDSDGHEIWHRVTASKKHIEISKEAAKEGMVLLKNKGSLLPLKKGSRISLFGKGTFDYVKGGGGSGDVHVPYVKNIYDGFMSLGDEVSIDQETADYYRNYVASQYSINCIPGMLKEPELPDALLEKAAAASDAAIISISRFSGEAWDRKSAFKDPEICPGDDRKQIELENEIFENSDFYLMKEEALMVEKVSKAFDKVIVILNVGGVVDSAWFADNDKISSVLAAWQGGLEGGTAAAELIMGHDTPSGKLADTFADRLEDYPSTFGFHESSTHVDYTEDIYVGYRYFETIPGAKEKVRYPFGFGLSYTTFSITDIDIHKASKEKKIDAKITPALSKTGPAADPDLGTNSVLIVNAKVTNTGSRSGREVVQLYYSAPQGLLGKPAKALIAYHKTALLSPGESESVCMYVNVDDMASYDDIGLIQKSSYVLEKGDYRFFIGTDVESAAMTDFVFTLEQDIVTQRLSSKLSSRQLSFRLRADGTFENLQMKEPFDTDENALDHVDYSLLEGTIPDIRAIPRHVYEFPGHGSRPQLIDVYNGKLSLEDFIASLSDEDLAFLLSGTPNTGAACTFGYGNLPLYGVPNIMTADGPAGLRVPEESGIRTTAFPCATLIACTWDPDIAYKIGAAGSAEVKENNIAAWLTPAVNIHRSPLCGRNFEYYSEDPYLTGVQAAAMVRGIQSNHIAATPKHFALNNKESNRRNSDSRCSERAIREIYLRQFEIIVKTAHPWCIMTSYNIINGCRASESKGLLTGILRNEWGFDGMVVTDWWNYGEQYKEINAGNDVKMGCGYPDRVLAALKKGVLSRTLMERSAANVLNLILKID